MKKYKLTIIENIVSGTLTKTMEIEAKDEKEAEDDDKESTGPLSVAEVK